MSLAESPAVADPRPLERKLAWSVSERLVSEIAAAGWPVGEVMGSETDLVERYGVSRAVFREAVRLLEHQGVARMRRGPGGGLVVTVPSVESAMDAVMVYLIYVHASLEEILEVRLVLEEHASGLATERLTEEGIGSLRDRVERETRGEQLDPRGLHEMIAGMSGNPALELFVDLLTRAAVVYSPHVEPSDMVVVDLILDAHARIVESIVGGDASRAAGRMRRHLIAEAEFVNSRLPLLPRFEALFASPSGEPKLAQSVARTLFAEIVSDGWVVGRPLGSESELMERIGVSRAVLREAIRVLEFHQIVVMRRGPGGGLFVAEPGMDATSDVVAMFLDRRGVRPDQFFEARSIIELKVLDRTIEHLDDSMIDRLREAHEVESAVSPETFRTSGHDLHLVLADLSKNKVLALFTDVTVRLSRRHSAAPADAPNPIPSDDVVKVHEAIIDAIITRDVDLARHRMRRHLEALSHWMR